MSSAQPSAKPEKLISQLLLEDAELRDIVEEFVEALPERLAELEQAFETLDWDQLAMLAHRLKGASGSYGYPDLSQLAAAMERAFRAQQANEFASWAKQFSALIAAARAGLAEDEPTSS